MTRRMTRRAPSAQSAPATPSHPSPGRQSGFSMIEASIVLVVMTVTWLGALQFQQFQQFVENGRQAGLRLAALRDGVERYARDHGEALSAMLAVPACVDVPLSAPLSPAPSTAMSTPQVCVLKLQVAGQAVEQTVAVNALQPTVPELRALGYVAHDDHLPFPHGSAVIDGRTGQIAEPRWAVSVQCHGTCGTGADARAAILRVTLYNTQPFFAQDTLPFGYGAQLKAALLALGPDARVSLPGESPQKAAQLRGRGADPVPNPLKGESADVGVAGVVASSRLVHLGSGAATRSIAAPRAVACGVPTGASGPGASGAACLDGSSKPTARWDFNDQTVDQVGQLSVNRDASVGGRVSAGGLHIRRPDRDPTRPHGPPVVHVEGGTHFAAGVAIGDTPRQADWSQPGLKLYGGILAVQGGGYGDFSGPGADSRQGGIRIPVRRPNTPCNAQGLPASMSGGNIALYQDARDIYVMVCRNGTGTGDGVWVKAKAG